MNVIADCSAIPSPDRTAQRLKRIEICFEDGTGTLNDIQGFVKGKLGG
jgi:hypothetical protein